jgi:hypothetical protein
MQIPWEQYLVLIRRLQWGRRNGGVAVVISWFNVLLIEFSSTV